MQGMGGLCMLERGGWLLSNTSCVLYKCLPVQVAVSGPTAMVCESVSVYMYKWILKKRFSHADLTPSNSILSQLN